MQLLAKFKQILYIGFRATLNFRKFKVALDPIYSEVAVRLLLQLWANILAFYDQFYLTFLMGNRNLQINFNCLKKLKVFKKDFYF